MSLSFNGTSDYLYDAAWHEAGSYNKWMIALWAKPDSSFTSGRRTMVAIDTTGVGPDYVWIQAFGGQASPPLNPHWEAVFFDGSTTITISHTPVSFYKWTHIAIRVDGSVPGNQTYRELWVDGVMQSSDSTSLGFDTTIKRLHVACRRIGLIRSQYWLGHLCDFALWRWSSTSDPGSYEWPLGCFNGLSADAAMQRHLLGYYPMISGEMFGVQDMMDAQDLTKYGGTWDHTEHPRMAVPCGGGW